MICFGFSIQKNLPWYLHPKIGHKNFFQIWDCCCCFSIWGINRLVTLLQCEKIFCTLFIQLDNFWQYWSLFYQYSTNEIESNILVTKEPALSLWFPVLCGERVYSRRKSKTWSGIIFSKSGTNWILRLFESGKKYWMPHFRIGIKNIIHSDDLTVCSLKQARCWWVSRHLCEEKQIFTKQDILSKFTFHLIQIHIHLFSSTSALSWWYLSSTNLMLLIMSDITTVFL